MRSHYLQQLSELEELMGKMGGLIVSGFEEVSAALTKPGANVVKDAANTEKRTDKKMEDIERLCSLLLLTQQPVASDMRFIVSVMNVVVDMERIGDQIRDIAEIASKCTKLPGADEITEMCEHCSVMIRGALDSYIGRDVEGARRVEVRDDKVDAAFESLKTQLGERIKTEENTDDILNYLMIGKYLERIGDHATNIAEWTNYVVKGVKDETNA
ncbi:MAG TPA: phosphate signaling complex protein PhoU [Candidatus Protoclostridium stercorigallinarum]|uniref:Phosphate-specific transport system accessory protein PhoU n=1 Tax=Candidatus Protoclostridium stercorigallinarum TaxID=2838741 RepID=A0A9D1TRH2_9FIRM|nr:phosphate signaling complex protein PhoU [Candidatus Protoclostridium stercorigallinarum]